MLARIVLIAGSGDRQPFLPSFWGDGFLDSRHLDVPFRNSGAPVQHLHNPKCLSPTDRPAELCLVEWMNPVQSEAVGDPEIASRITSHDRTCRMKSSVPKIADLNDEPGHLHFCMPRSKMPAINPRYS